MKRLYQARDTIEANLLKDRLAERHIAARIFGEYTVGAIGELPAIHFPEVWVEEEDLVPARRVVAEFLAPAPDKGRWRCAECGELVEGQFDLCWKCGAPRH